MSDPTDDLLSSTEGQDNDGDGYDEIIVEYFDDDSSVATYDFDADGKIDAVDVDIDGDGQVDFAIVAGENDDEVGIVADPSTSKVVETVSIDEAEAIAPGLIDLLGEDHGDVDLSDLDTDVDTDADTDAPASNPFVVDDEDDDDDDDDSDEDDDVDPVDDGKHPQGDPDSTDLVGDPFGDAELWFEQAVNGTCAPSTVAQLVSEYTGVTYTDEQEFADMAVDNGWMDVYPDGTTSGMYSPDIVDLLNEAGVPATLEDGLDLDDLKQLLADDVGVAVMVDADEYWNPMYGMPEEAEDYQPNHIVMVTGVDESEGVVYINDTGTPDGEALAVPIEYFMDAWDDSGSQAVVCSEPAPGSDDVTPVDNDDDDDDRDDEDKDKDDDEGSGFGASLHTEPNVSSMVQGSWALLPIVLSGATVSASA